MPSALVFYHYFHPDDVVSAVHLTELCEELIARGWSVTAMPCNRSCRDESQTHPTSSTWKDISIRRVWRPGLKQASAAGRMINALWMTARWSLEALLSSPDVVIVGTDPVLSVISASAWKIFKPRTVVAHWCFDLYPEAAIADGLLAPDGAFLKFIRPLLRHAYRSCDLMVDIGDCMRRLLDVYGSRGRKATLVPWALSEPASALAVDAEERRALYGDAPLALMYSGNFGRAHTSDLMLKLMGRLKPSGARMVFSVRGNRAEQLQREAASMSNIGFVGFAPQERLEARLSAADIQVVSLRPEWTGTVVPSKFFGALAAGRPVLFAGSENSAVAKWIRQFDVGWVLTESTFDDVVASLSRQTPATIAQMFDRCHAAYRDHFSKRAVMDGWDRELRASL